MAYTPNAYDPNNPAGSTPVGTLSEELRTIKQALVNIKSMVESNQNSTSSQFSALSEEMVELETLVETLSSRWNLNFFDDMNTFPNMSRQWGFTLKAITSTGERPIYIKGGYMTVNDNSVTDVTFKEPFPTRCIFATVDAWFPSSKRTRSATHIVGTIFDKTKVGFQQHEGDTPVVWLAIGY